MLSVGHVICLITCSFGALALPKTTGSSVLHEKREVAPHTWTRISRARPSEVLPVKIGLTQSNLQKAEEYLLDVSHPYSSNFGKHWTAEKVANTFAPSKETIDSVTEWLIDAGIHAERFAFSSGRNWVMFNATVLEAEFLFDTEYYYYKHETSGGYRIACDKYYLPQHVQRHIDFAVPTVQLEGMRPIENLNLGIRPPVVGLTGLDNCYELITIECLRELYQFGPGNTSAPGNEIGIPAFGSYLYPPDLELYFANYTTQPIPASMTPDFVSIDGGEHWKDTFSFGSEAPLDIQTAYSIVYPQNVRLYQVGDVNTASTTTFNTFLDAVDSSYCGGDDPDLDAMYPDPGGIGYAGPLQCGGAPLSNVLSFSYLQVEATMPASYQIRQCHEWMKLGLQGVSVIFASGDSGVANRFGKGKESSCLTPEFEGPYICTVEDNGTQFAPSFPSNCPWVTTVGATFLKDRNISNGEVAVSLPFAADHKRDYYSGGGFSNIFARPAYQADAVSNYLATYPPPYDAQTYNNRGRGFPDISAIGLNVSVVIGGGVQVAGGTSSSTPIIASIVTLLNEERIAAGKGPIGFLNPILYAHPDAFHDIVEGSNPGCGTDGFQAQPGWDPVTGVGTPIYPILRDIVLNLP